jgi:PhnB protein
MSPAFQQKGTTAMQPTVKAIPNGMHTITPHIIVRDAARAVEWYKEALGAEERSRVPLPGGKLMSVELWFGDSTVMVADEFPEMGVLSPQTVGGTSTVLHLYTEDVEILWKRAVDAGAVVLHPLQDQFWGDRHGQFTIHSATAGGWPSTYATSRPRRSLAPRRRRSVESSLGGPRRR